MKGKLFLTMICILITSTLCYASEDEKAWGSVINLAEALIGEGSLIDAEGAEGKLDALIDLHVAFCTEITGKKISSQQIMATKQGMRLFLKTAGERYQGDKRKAILRLLRDLATNRAVFIEILTSDSPSEVIEQQMMAYLERNQAMVYKESIAIPEQVSVIQADTPLKIVEEGIRLISDSGTSGHYNMAIDAGEVITLNIPLKNISDEPFRSTSGFLQTEDKYVRVGNSEVLYTERSEIDGQTVTFAPGKSITPSQHFVFTISPDCPDGHKVDFTLLAWDSDRGKYKIPFLVTIYHVGPLDFGRSRIDDDIPGPSNGNGNNIIEFGEVIEYVLSIQNKGQVSVEEISATLFTPSTYVRFDSGDDSLKYKSVKPDMERPISSSFVFSLEFYLSSNEYPQKVEKMIQDVDANTDRRSIPQAQFRIMIKGIARGYNYSWIQQRTHNIGISDMFYRHIVNLSQKYIDQKTALKAAKLLSHEWIKYRVEKDDSARLMLANAREQGAPAAANEKLREISKRDAWNMREISKLLREGGSVQSIPGILLFAVAHGYADEIPLLVDKGAKINQKIETGIPTLRGPSLTPLSYSILKTPQDKKLKTVRKILESGGNVNGYLYDSTSISSGRNPLEEAIKQGNVELVELLLKYKPKLKRAMNVSSYLSIASDLMIKSTPENRDHYRKIIRLLKNAGAE